MALDRLQRYRNLYAVFTPRKASAPIEQALFLILLIFANIFRTGPKSFMPTKNGPTMAILVLGA